MKITKVTPWLVSFPWEVRTGVEQKLESRDRQLVFVQVDTDEGTNRMGRGDDISGAGGESRHGGDDRPGERLPGWREHE